jgi:hypothetical protein
MRLWGCQNPPNEISLNHHESTVPIHVTPLQANLLTEAEAGAKRQKHPGMPPWKMRFCRPHEEGRFVSGEHLYWSFDLVTTAKVSTHSKRRVRRQLSVFYRLG